MNPNQSETSLSIQINASSDWSKDSFQSELIRIIPTSDSFGLVRIYLDSFLGLNRIRSNHFLPFSIKRVIKRFSDWFGMIRIGSDTYIGMNRNSSDWLGINSYPILSTGKVLVLCKKWFSKFSSNLYLLRPPESEKTVFW